MDSELALTRLLDLSGRVALVTGAGQGVGAATAQLLAAQGASVAVNDFYEERALQVAEAISGGAGRTVGVRGDVSNPADVNAMVADIEQSLGPIDVLVNNAGNAGAQHDAITDRPPFWETEPDEWTHWIAVNYLGVMHVTRAVVGGMVRRGRGRVITVISDAGRVGEPDLVVYSGAKAGAAGFMRGLAKAVGPHSVTANCVALGAIRTPAVAAMLDDDRIGPRIARSYPMRRVGNPADPAALIAFLASDAAGWITGQTYPVNGGYSMAQ